jgi:hypothetical protein
MKKLMTLVSVVVMAAGFSMGCKKAEETKPADPAATAPAPTEAKPAEAKPAEAKPADPAAAAAPAAAPGSTGIAECDGYLATAEKFAKCDKLPKEAKDAQGQALEAAKAGWASLKDPNVPAEAKKAAADACKQSDDALKQAWTAAGCQ